MENKDPKERKKGKELLVGGGKKDDNKDTGRL